MTVVSDSSPLISLAHLERLSLVPALFGSVQIAAEVYDEIVLRGANRPGAREIGCAEWIVRAEQAPPERLAAVRQSWRLGAGETATLLLAQETGAGLVLADDADARAMFRAYGFAVSGVLGLLERGYRLNYISDLRAAFQLIIDRRIRIDRTLLNASLARYYIPPL